MKPEPEETGILSKEAFCNTARVLLSSKAIF